MKALPAVLGILAVITAFPAWMPTSKDVVQEKDRTGELLTKSGKDIAPEKVASLRVVTWDDSAAKAKVFEVKQVNGSWVIPSHYNYPADGGTRVGQTSGNVRGVARGRLVTSDPKQYDDLNVNDPLAEDSNLKGRGKRVVLKDITDGVLIDLIIGKAVPDSEGYVFVRDADEAAVYTAKFEGDISTRFIDWVEPDLLKFNSADVRSVTVADYSIDEQTSSISERSTTRVERVDENGTWTTEAIPDGKQVNKTTLDAIINQATGLRLSGVRRFSLQWLQAAGFFPTDNPTLLKRPDALKVGIGNKQYALFGNEGRVDFTTKEGLRYSLLFGEISSEDEDKPADAADQAKKTEQKEGATGHNRYMSVYVQYVPEADEAAKQAIADAAKPAEGTPAKPEEKPKTPAEIAKEFADKGNEKAAKEQRRFVQFFYVISDENFKALRPALDKMFEDKPKEEATKPGGVTGAIGDELGLPPDRQAAAASGETTPPAPATEPAPVNEPTPVTEPAPASEPAPAPETKPVAEPAAAPEPAPASEATPTPSK